ncbi:MAG: hypothetical protein HYZ65_15300 [Burkholderiales bacterium]|nr:hypothetical protein [Burkholderiales bacterium]
MDQQQGQRDRKIEQGDRGISQQTTESLMLVQPESGSQRPAPVEKHDHGDQQPGPQGGEIKEFCNNVAHDAGSWLYRGEPEQVRRNELQCPSLCRRSGLIARLRPRPALVPYPAPQQAGAGKEYGKDGGPAQPAKTGQQRLFPERLRERESWHIYGKHMHAPRIP